MKGLIIGVTGLARAGKDEFASRAVSQHRAYADSFAGPLRAFLINILGIANLDELDKIKDLPSDILGGRTPRYAMQTIGTEWGRQTISDSIWVDSCMARIKNNSDNRTSVISDVRFENEAVAITELGGIIVKVVRAGVRIAESSHVSEGGISDMYVDYIVHNNNSLNEYYDEIDSLMYMINTQSKTYEV
jgi:hypothetical protein